MIRNEFWSTPVWQVDTELGDKFNASLLKEINAIQSPPGSDFNIWNYNTEAVNTLRHTILTIIGDVVAGEIPAHIKQKLELKRGWVNYHRTGESLATHNHGNATVVCTYYVKAPHNCGDLLLFDPRGGVNWGWEVEGSIVGVKHIRMKPKEGSLVFFPGYLLHSVDVNRSPLPRISLSSNLILA